MCGVFGFCNNCNNNGRQGVVRELMIGGSDVAHRGEQGWGVATSYDNKIFCHRREGRFGEGITERKAEELVRKMPGNLGLAHALYSTVGRSGHRKQPKNIQPYVADFHGRQFALSYNGNVYDLSGLREVVRARGWKFKSSVSDTEVIVALISTSEKTDFLAALQEVLPLLKGAFSLVLLYDGKIFGARDRFGIRPLCIGSGEDYSILSSESCAFYSIGAKLVREARPGEIVVIGEKGIERCINWAENPCSRFCIFEFVYFARPDSVLSGGMSAWHYRTEAGKILARESPVEADIVISSPSGGDIYTEAYTYELNALSHELDAQFVTGLFKTRFIVRTFLTPRGTDRKKLQRRKLHPFEEVLRGKRVCIVEDSIVRNNVCPEIVTMCFEAGAREVHVRVGSSPVVSPCYYGIDMATKGELAATNLSIEQIREQTTANSLAYLSLDGMVRATGLPKENLCLACFNGDYPVPPPTEVC